MNRAADAVSGEPVHDRKPARPDRGLDRPTDRVDLGTRTCDRERRVKRVARTRRKTRRDVGPRPDDHRTRGIGDVAVLLDRDIELDQIARRKTARSGDAVNDLIVHADEHGPRKSIDDRRRRARAVLGEDARRHCVESGGADTGANARLQCIEGQLRDAARAAQPFPIVSGFDGHMGWRVRNDAPYW